MTKSKPKSYCMVVNCHHSSKCSCHDMLYTFKSFTKAFMNLFKPSQRQCCVKRSWAIHVLVLEPIPCDYNYLEIVFMSNFERWMCQSDAKICYVPTHQLQGKTQIFQVQACNTPILNKELENFVWNFSHKCCNKCVPKTIHMLSYPYPLSNRWENRLACHIGYNEL